MNVFEFIDKVIKKPKRFYYNRKYHAILRQFDVSYDKITLNGKIKFVLEQGGKVVFGENFICSSGPEYSIDPRFISSINVKKNATLLIGENSGITGTSIHVHQEVIIGNNVNIGAGTLIYDTNFHSTDPIIRANRALDLLSVDTAPIFIGNNVFIGARSLIGKGVTIGENSIIAAGSVVVKNVPSNQVWGGNPATYLKNI